MEHKTLFETNLQLWRAWSIIIELDPCSSTSVRACWSWRAIAINSVIPSVAKLWYWVGCPRAVADALQQNGSQEIQIMYGNSIWRNKTRGRARNTICRSGKKNGNRRSDIANTEEMNYLSWKKTQGSVLAATIRRMKKRTCCDVALLNCTHSAPPPLKLVDDEPAWKLVLPPLPSCEMELDVHVLLLMFCSYLWTICAMLREGSTIN